jgi:hypothetical protein
MLATMENRYSVTVIVKFLRYIRSDETRAANQENPHDPRLTHSISECLEAIRTVVDVICHSTH